jgi:hypothetical protein
MSGTAPGGSEGLPRIPGLELREKVGEGGTGEVYAAVHVALQRRVAVKVLAPADAAAAPEWLRESRLTAALTHPHVVTVHDAGQVDGRSYLVMEYLAGGSLRERMAPGRPWPLADAIRLLEEVARALDHIHATGILHLDLKPENILFAADGQVKIADFGLAVPRAEADSLMGGRGFRGTLDYCAPEARADLALDARADVFSLATVAYELLTGRLPGRVYIPASGRNPRLPKALDAVLRRGLARDPEDRYASVAEFRRALSDAGRPAGPRFPVRPLGVLAAVAALVVIPLVAYRWGPGTGSSTESPAPEAVPPPGPAADQPERLLALYDDPKDLALLSGLDDGDGLPVPVERVPVETPPRRLPAGVPLPVWPAPRPVLVIQSPGAWGFVHPLQDRSLGRRVVAHWPDLVRMTVPPKENLVKAGGFDGDSLVKGHKSDFWRGGDTSDWTSDRRIALDRPPDQPDNPALLLVSPVKKLLGCYQSLSQGPPPGAVVVLRYRARSLAGEGALAVYAGMPVAIPEGETGPITARLRATSMRLAPEPNDRALDRWLYRSPAWVTPSPDWQTYLVVTEAPPYPNRLIHRNLVIDLAGPGQVWVDDIELFVWRPGEGP